MTDRSRLIESDAYVELRGAFAALAQRQMPPADRDLAILRERVEDLVDAMKTNGALAERVVIAIKMMAQDSEVLWILGGRIPDYLVMWCLDRYFERPQLETVVISGSGPRPPS
jgi:hypothetical protein